MVDLLEFLNARLDEDEAVARAATPGPWKTDDPLMSDFVGSTVLKDYVATCSVRSGYRENSIQDAAHIARYDPVRILREVKAKRRVLTRHRPTDPDWAASQRAWHDKYGGDLPFELQPPPCVGCGTSSRGGRRGEAYMAHRRTRNFTKCPELLDLVLPYAGHPDYDPAWDLASG